jgi:hypothetical protein
MTREDSGELCRGVRLPVDDAAVTDQANDIAAIRVKRDWLPSTVRFAQIDPRAEAIKDGSTVVLAGFAWDNSFPLKGEARAVGVTIQSGRFDSTVNATKGLSSNYNTNDHFLVPYTRTEDGVRPHGFSGTAAWCNAEQAGAVWAPHPVLVGVQTSWFPRSKLMQVVRLGPVLRLLGNL